MKRRERYCEEYKRTGGLRLPEQSFIANWAMDVARGAVSWMKMGRRGELGENMPAAMVFNRVKYMVGVLQETRRQWFVGDCANGTNHFQIFFP